MSNLHHAKTKIVPLNLFIKLLLGSKAKTVLAKSGVRNYQILLLVEGQVNGQNPLVQPRFTCPKIDIFSYFSKKTYGVGTH